MSFIIPGLVSSVVLAIFASTISTHFDDIATSINCGGDLHVHRQMHHCCVALLCISFWTHRRQFLPRLRSITRV